MARAPRRHAADVPVRSAVDRLPLTMPGRGSAYPFASRLPRANGAQSAARHGLPFRARAPDRTRTMSSFRVSPGWMASSSSAGKSGSSSQFPSAGVVAGGRGLAAVAVLRRLAAVRRSGEGGSGALRAARGVGWRGGVAEIWRLVSTLGSVRVELVPCNSLMWRSITGTPAAPPPRPGVHAHGLPWFDYYAEGAPAVGGTGFLSKIKSILTLEKERAPPASCPKTIP